MNHQQPDFLGSVELEPQDPVVAGSVGTWTVRYSVGSAGIDEGGTIKLAKRAARDAGPSVDELVHFHRPELH